jgi:hypothetical protein
MHDDNLGYRRLLLPKPGLSAVAPEAVNVRDLGDRG